jgi:DNA-binding NarL/FixJ family response regulator
MRQFTLADAMARVLLADDHPLFRQALRAAVMVAQPELEVEEAGTLQAACAALKAKRDYVLILLDLKMPDCGGLFGLLTLSSEAPQLPIVVVSANENPDAINRVMALGAAGFIPKSASVNEISQGLVAVLKGDLCAPALTPKLSVPAVVDSLASLTATQLRILTALHRGLPNKQIAFEMGVAEGTVKAHISVIFRKLNVTNRTQLLVVTRSLMLDEAPAA